jgi:hypothetical protein
MHAEAQARMRGIVLSVLPNLSISDNGYLEAEALGVTLEPLSGFIAKNFSEWVEVDFIHAYVSLNDAITAQGLNQMPGQLIQTCTEAQRETIAQSVVDYWAGAPYRYEFVFQLPGLDPFENPVEIAPGVTFKNVLIEQPALLGIPFLGGLLAAGANAAAQPAPPQQGACLAVSSKGLMQSSFSGGVTENAAIRRAKIALQLAMTTGALDTRYTDGKSFSPVSEAAFTTLQGPPPKFVDVRLPASFGSVLSRVRRPEDAPPLIDALKPVGVVLTHEDHRNKRAAKNPKEVAESHFARQCARIATAAEWLFDAEGERTPTSLVQTAIAFEALYGGSKQEPVVETLANRVAYTLGKTPQEREELMNSFTTFYATRSKVVHSGASRLTREQQVHLTRANWTLHRALRHELVLVEEGVKVFQPVNAGPQPPPPLHAEPA